MHNIAHYVKHILALEYGMFYTYMNKNCIFCKIIKKEIPLIVHN
jgi:hypothetical protein